MPAHPSQTGKNTGSGESGSVQWSNAVRVRLYVSKPKKDGDNDEPDPDIRQLTVMKSNWTASGQTIDMRWTRVIDAYGQSYGGVFVEDAVVEQVKLGEDGKPVVKTPQEIKREQETKIDADFMEMFRKALSMKMSLSSKKKAENNPAVKFAEFPGSRYRGDKGKLQIREAMMRLLTEDVIRIFEGGSASRPTEKLGFGATSFEVYNRKKYGHKV
jgi:RecA-family ATPase